MIFTEDDAILLASQSKDSIELLDIVVMEWSIDVATTMNTPIPIANQKNGYVRALWLLKEYKVIRGHMLILNDKNRISKVEDRINEIKIIVARYELLRKRKPC